MSVVTGVILLTGSGEADYNLRQVNLWLRDNGFSDLNKVDDYCCNGKHPQMNILGGGYNYFKDSEFVEFFQSLVWYYPENVVLILKHEQDPTEIYFSGLPPRMYHPVTDPIKHVQTSGPRCKRCTEFTTYARVRSHGLCMKCELKRNNETN